MLLALVAIGAGSYVAYSIVVIQQNMPGTGSSARNTGNQAFYLESNLETVSFSGLPSGVTGSFSLTSQQLAPGATSTITLTLTNDGNATSGPFTFMVTFRGYATSTG